MLRKIRWFFQGLWARHTRELVDPEIIKVIIE
ncbi:hypothetical protein LCGC14_2600760, partial [marine sediment metagenome]